jgi:hypothetical protein
VERVVAQIMVSAGGGEVLVDEIGAFVGVLERASAGNTGSGVDSGGGGGGEKLVQRSMQRDRRLHFVVADKASHEEMILDRILFGRRSAKAADVEQCVHTVLAERKI